MQRSDCYKYIFLFEKNLSFSNHTIWLTLLGVAVPIDLFSKLFILPETKHIKFYLLLG